MQKTDEGGATTGIARGACRRFFKQFIDGTSFVKSRNQALEFPVSNLEGGIGNVRATGNFDIQSHDLVGTQPERQATHRHQVDSAVGAGDDDFVFINDVTDAQGPQSAVLTFRINLTVSGSNTGDGIGNGHGEYS